jgi:hypothetical protein
MGVFFPTEWKNNPNVPNHQREIVYQSGFSIFLKNNNDPVRHCRDFLTRTLDEAVLHGATPDQAFQKSAGAEIAQVHLVVVTCKFPQDHGKIMGRS